MAKIFYTLLFLRLNELKLSVQLSCALATLDALGSPTWRGATCRDRAAQRGPTTGDALHPYELKCGRNMGRHPGCHRGAGEHLGPHLQNQNLYFVVFCLYAHQASEARHKPLVLKLGCTLESGELNKYQGLGAAPEILT